MSGVTRLDSALSVSDYMVFVLAKGGVEPFKMGKGVFGGQRLTADTAISMPLFGIVDVINQNEMTDRQQGDQQLGTITLNGNPGSLLAGPSGASVQPGDFIGRTGSWLGALSFGDGIRSDGLQSSAFFNRIVILVKNTNPSDCIQATAWVFDGCRLLNGDATVGQPWTFSLPFNFASDPQGEGSCRNPRQYGVDCFGEGAIVVYDPNVSGAGNFNPDGLGINLWG